MKTLVWHERDRWNPTEVYWRLLISDDVEPRGHTHDDIHTKDFTECEHGWDSCGEPRLYGHNFYLSDEQAHALLKQLQEALK